MIISDIWWQEAKKLKLCAHEKFNDMCVQLSCLHVWKCATDWRVFLVQVQHTFTYYMKTENKAKQFHTSMLISTCCAIFKCFWSRLCCFQARALYGHTSGEQPLCMTNCSHTYTVWPWNAEWTGTRRLWLVDSAQSICIYHQGRCRLDSFSWWNLNWLRTWGYGTCCHDNWWRRSSKSQHFSFAFHRA